MSDFQTVRAPIETNRPSLPIIQVKKLRPRQVTYSRSLI